MYFHGILPQEQAFELQKVNTVSTAPCVPYHKTVKSVAMPCGHLLCGLTVSRAMF